MARGQINQNMKGNVLHLEIDLGTAKDRTDAPLSSTGKSRLVATSGGFLPVIGLDGVKMMINITGPK